MENTKQRRLKRRSSAIMAGVLVIALLLTGTFAWVSTTQRAKNEVSGTVDYDVILHDDFDKGDDFTEGGEKSVYAENYGQNPLYIRIRLDEYMEVGRYAGLTETESQAKALADGVLTQAEIDAIIAAGGSVKQAASLIAGAQFEDETTWTPHVPLNKNTTDDCPEFFHDYWHWTMGGEKNYLPQEFQSAANFLPGGAVQDTTEYDGTETNVEKTLNATKVITMAKWIEEGMNPGPFWVIDKDGWAYWAQALEGGDATGLLLSQITLQPVPDDDYYYAINVLMQAASKGDWGFDINDSQNTAPSNDALSLLNKIADIEPTVKSISIANGDKIYVPAGTQVALEANVVSQNGASTAVTWAIGSTSGSSMGTVNVNSNGIFTAGAGSEGKVAVVSATAVSDSTKSATVKVIVIPVGLTVVQGGDGLTYVDYGDNTFKQIKDDGTLGSWVCGGYDQKPGTADDRTDVIVSADGTKYLGENANGSYNKAGPDGKLGTADDAFVWRADTGNPINGDNESATPPTGASSIVKSVVVSPSSVSVVKGNTQTFTAVVTMADDSGNADGVTWSLSDTTKGSSITQAGVLTVGASETNTTLIVTATSKKDGSTVGTATVTVKSAITDGAGEIGTRTLTDAQTGDGEWIEIATNGGYSLIVRADSVENRLVGPATNGTAVNTWFNSTLSGTAPLRNYTVTSDWSSKPGTYAKLNSDNGFSVPTGTKASTGDGVAFLLSVQEVANYCSYKWPDSTGYNTLSVTQAYANWQKLSDGASGLWFLRTSKNVSSVAVVGNNGIIGWTYTTSVYGNVRPALWVDSSIFFS